jgi:hypothetical protein
MDVGGTAFLLVLDRRQHELDGGVKQWQIELPATNLLRERVELVKPCVRAPRDRGDVAVDDRERGST